MSLIETGDFTTKENIITLLGIFIALLNFNVIFFIFESFFTFSTFVRLIDDKNNSPKNDMIVYFSIIFFIKIMNFFVLFEIALFNLLVSLLKIYLFYDLFTSRNINLFIENKVTIYYDVNKIQNINKYCNNWLLLCFDSMKNNTIIPCCMDYAKQIYSNLIKKEFREDFNENDNDNK
jgi:hypothetical protein